MTSPSLDQVRDLLTEAGVEADSISDILMLVRHEHKENGPEMSHAAQNRAELYAQMLNRQGIPLEGKVYVCLVNALSEYFMSEATTNEGA